MECGMMVCSNQLLNHRFKLLTDMIFIRQLYRKRRGYSLVSNHPFIDGNKRIGIHIMLVFLAINGIDISCTQEDLIKIGLSLADDTMTFEELSVWLSSHN